METGKKGGSERKEIRVTDQEAPREWPPDEAFPVLLNGFDTPQPIGSPLINLTVMIM
jgi:hypothetical protein